MGTLTDLALFLVLLILLTAWIVKSSRDDTDGKDRSGLILYTDHKTGVQYVGTLLGGITPRLNPDGSIHTVDEKQ